MDRVIYFGFTIVNNPFPDRKELAKKGKKLYDSKHVKNVVERYCHAEKSSKITGSVIPQTNVSKAAYELTLHVSIYMLRTG